MSKIRLLSALAGLVLSTGPGCTATPIDAVTELEATASAGTGSSTSAGSNNGTGGISATTGGVPDELAVGICDARLVPAPGEYLIMARDTGACLTAGGTTMIVGASTPGAEGNLVYLDEDCSGVDEQRWYLYPEQSGLSTDSWYVEVRNQALDLNLDMEARSAFDGTRALLYDPHDMENQRFYFDSRGADYYAIRPAHVANHCLQQMDTGEVQMYACEGEVGFVDTQAQLAQQWQLASEDCLE